MSRTHTIALGLLAAAAIHAPRAAWGADLVVDPVRVHVPAAERSASMTLTNESHERMRYEVTVQAWRQGPDGSMILTPTEDIVFFPSLLEIAPGQTRRIRVAARGGAGTVETTYRMLVTPLPEAAAPGQVRVLTRLSIPVFVQPPAPTPRPAATVRLDHGRAIVSVANPGNSYFVPRTVRVRGRSRLGAPLFERDLPGWYVLAHSERVYELPLPDALCRELGSLQVIVSTPSGDARAASEVSAEGCGAPSR